MFAAEEYKTYINSGDKGSLESVVTLAESENKCDEYLKRLLLRRLFLFDDFNERQINVLLKRVGILNPPQTLRQIAEEYGVTDERIRQIEAKALHKIMYPYAETSSLTKYTTQEDFAKVTLHAVINNYKIAETLNSYLQAFDER